MTQKGKTYVNTGEIYKILRGEILSLHLTPGTFIGEVEMAKRFQASRTPIREVFKHLEIDGLIHVIPNKGTVITAINFSEISEFMFIREKLELGVAEYLLEHFTQEEQTKMEIILLKQQKILKSQDIPLSQRTAEFYVLDNEFHHAIFYFGKKTALWEKMSDMMPDYKRFRVISADFHSEKHLWDLYQHHENILKGFEQKDLNLLKETYQQHIYYGAASFRQLIHEKEHYFVL